MSPLSQLSLQIAISNIGRKEATGNNDGPFVHMLQLLAVDGGHSLYQQPWCAMFTMYCTSQAAAELSLVLKTKLTPSSTVNYALAKSGGYIMEKPIAGCIGLIRAPAGSGKTHDHTFLVESVGQSTVNGVDGNWANQVMRTVHEISNCDFIELS